VERYGEIPHEFSHEGFQVIESGDLMTEIKGVYRMGNSKLEMYYRFYDNCAYFDVRYRVAWDEKHMVLKLESDVSQNKHTVAVPGGWTQRESSSADVPMGEWIRCDSVSILADGIFAYSMENQVLGLTLLRSPIYGDLRISELDDSVDYDIIDRGIVEGKLRVSFEGTPWKIAEAFQNPPVVIDESNHDGILPSTYSFCSIEGDGVILTALKRCEDDESEVIRLTECCGKETEATVRSNDTEHRIPMKPYEIKTVKLSAESWQEVNMLELEYDTEEKEKI
jgi:alpha-mannosidase